MSHFEVWEQKLCPRIQGLFLSRVLAQISKRDENRWDLPLPAASFPEECRTWQQIPDNWLALMWKKCWRHRILAEGEGRAKLLILPAHNPESELRYYGYYRYYLTLTPSFTTCLETSESSLQGDLGEVSGSVPHLCQIFFMTQYLTNPLKEGRDYRSALPLTSVREASVCDSRQLMQRLVPGQNEWP